jgi:K+-sensing histidine kinase KdpD
VKRQLKIALILAAVAIAAASLVVSHYLVRDLENEERSRMEIWAEAMHTLSVADENADLNLVLKVLEQNHNIPVIVTDANGEVQISRNVTSLASVKDVSHEDSIARLKEMARTMEAQGRVIKVQIGEGSKDFLKVCYDDSLLLTRLEYYPYIQLAVVMLFIIIAIFALLASKKAEQNKVWVGLSKETAHQLGTPISSLMAWTEILRETYPNDELIPEMDKDVRRLQLIADRFSKIGSAPEMKDVELGELLQHVVEYMNRRTSQKVEIKYTTPKITVHVNPLLFEWVFENLCKNAVDAMEGKGTIQITAHADERITIIDVSDTGKGITSQNLQEVFNPGYTTKKRGWGLGLSLAKRIIEEYHNGKIYVLASERGKGTTFRIEMRVKSE